MSFFDLALEINKGLAWRRGVRALRQGDATALLRALDDGMSPNARIPAKDINWPALQDEKYTTPMLALVQMPTGDMGMQGRQMELFERMLAVGGDPGHAIEGDVRNTVVHAANYRRLDLWQAMHAAGYDFFEGGTEDASTLAKELGWEEGSLWLIQVQAERLNRRTPHPTFNASPRRM